MTLPVHIIFLLLLVILLANTVESITGFAGTLLAMPFAILLIGADDAKVVMNMVAILLAVSIVFQNRKFINWRQTGKIILFMLIGMVAGIVLYDLLPLGFLLKAYGVMIILVALKNLFLPSGEDKALPGWAGILILVGAGIIHGMFVSGGALLVIYATAALKDKHEFRATLEPVWIVLNLVMLVQQALSGLYTPQNVLLILLSIPPLLLANFLGNKIHKRIDQATFLKLANVLLIVAGGSLLI